MNIYIDKYIPSDIQKFWNERSYVLGIRKIICI